MVGMAWLKSWYWPTRRLLRHGRTRMRGMQAYLWRRLLCRTRFIAISGSVGKTTTKELLAGILEQFAPTARTPGNCNHRKFGGPEATLLSVRPWHRFAVIEAGIERPGDMRSVARLIKPDIAVMLEVKRCHTNVFRSVEAIAREKGELLKSLRRSGDAVINRDNPLVVSMLDHCRARITGFGRSEQATIRLLDAHSNWPDRLQLTIEFEGRKFEIGTRLVGEHWTNSVLAALSAATRCGVAMKDAIRALEKIEPFWARMQPVTLPGSGATIIRDEWNGSIDTFEAAFAFLNDASAPRKIVVTSDYSDSSTKLRGRANRLGRKVAEVADVAVFVGDYAERSATSAVNAGMPAGNVHSFVTLAGATEFLRKTLQAGDLVLIKGQANHHLSRIYLGLLGPVSCTTLSCSRQFLCDRCDDSGLQRRPEFKGLVADAEAFV